MFEPRPQEKLRFLLMVALALGCSSASFTGVLVVLGTAETSLAIA